MKGRTPYAQSWNQWHVFVRWDSEAWVLTGCRMLIHRPEVREWPAQPPRFCTLCRTGKKVTFPEMSDG